MPGLPSEQLSFLLEAGCCYPHHPSTLEGARRIIAKSKCTHCSSPNCTTNHILSLKLEKYDNIREDLQANHPELRIFYCTLEIGILGRYLKPTKDAVSHTGLILEANMQPRIYWKELPAHTSPALRTWQDRIQCGTKQSYKILSNSLTRTTLSIFISLFNVVFTFHIQLVFISLARI